jgi:hypothetical protein
VLNKLTRILTGEYLFLQFDAVQASMRYAADLIKPKADEGRKEGIFW